MRDALVDAGTPRGLSRNRRFAVFCGARWVAALGAGLWAAWLTGRHDGGAVAWHGVAAELPSPAIWLLPWLLLTPWCGVLADRLGRRGLLAAAYSGLGLAALASAWPATGGATAALGLSVTATSAGWALAIPCQTALLPRLVRRRRLVRANAVILILCVLGLVVAVQGARMLPAPSNIAYRLDVWTLLVAGLLLRGLLSIGGGPPRVAGSRTPGELVAGFRYALRHRHVGELLGIAALVWFCTAALCVLALLSRRDAEAAGDALGLVLRSAGFGVLAGATLMTLLDHTVRSEIVLSWGLIGVGAGGAVVALGHSVAGNAESPAWLMSAGVMLIAGSASAALLSCTCLLQRTVADRFRGRIAGLRGACAAAAMLAAAGAVSLQNMVRPAPSAATLAVAVLAIVGGVVTIRTRVRRSVHDAKLLFLEHLNDFLMRILYRFERIGPSTVPRHGPVIVASNHRCSLDPWILCAGAPYRRISFLIAAEYAYWPIVRYYVKAIEGIPVRRGSRETGATKQALRRLQAGRALGVFIEGGILPPGEPRRPMDGAAVLALKTGATVIPAYISGMRYRDGLIAGLLTRHRARVRFGRPVDLSEFAGRSRDRAQIRAATQKIYAAIQALAPRTAFVPDDEAYRPATALPLETSV